MKSIPFQSLSLQLQTLSVKLDAYFTVLQFERKRMNECTFKNKLKVQFSEEELISIGNSTSTGCVVN